MTKSWKPDVCIYHDKCNDGFGAAWAVWLRWGDDVEYVPASYGKPLGVDVTDKNVLFVDFSLKASELIELQTNSIVVLDHHKTAEAELMLYDIKVDGGKCFTPEDVQGMLEKGNLSSDRIIAYFDINKSGARLSWEFCHPGEDVLALICFIEDRYLWRFNLSYTKEVHATICSYDYSFAQFSAFAENSIADLVDAGKHILRYHDRLVQELCDKAFVHKIDEYVVPCVNAPGMFASDVCHELLQRNPEAPFAASFSCSPKEGITYSLRSEDSRIDVSEVAKRFGGGGHRNAAGFSTHK